MSALQENLKHSLRMKFGLAPHEPTDEQLRKITEFIGHVQRSRYATDADWETACRHHCPSTGTCSYKGLDMSDLNMLLDRIRGKP